MLSSEILQKASCAAYDEAIRAAYRTLSSSITEYFEEHPEFYNTEALEVSNTFRPLKEYERTLKIQQLALRLALRTADLVDKVDPHACAAEQHAQFLPNPTSSEINWRSSSRLS
jgi:hypothetical protein